MLWEGVGYTSQLSNSWNQFVLNFQIVGKYKDKFKTLVSPLTPNIQFFNIIMVGESGAGKSSLLNTFTTALSKKEDIADIYRIGPSTHGKKSATQEVHFNSVKFRN